MKFFKGDQLRILQLYVIWWECDSDWVRLWRSPSSTLAVSELCSGTFRITVTRRNSVSTQKAPTVSSFLDEISADVGHVHASFSKGNSLRINNTLSEYLQIICIWIEITRLTFLTANPVTCLVTYDAPADLVLTGSFVGLRSWNGVPELDRHSRINWTSGKRKQTYYESD